MFNCIALPLTTILQLQYSCNPIAALAVTWLVWGIYMVDLHNIISPQMSFPLKCYNYYKIIMTVQIHHVNFRAQTSHVANSLKKSENALIVAIL